MLLQLIYVQLSRRVALKYVQIVVVVVERSENSIDAYIAFPFLVVVVAAAAAITFARR